MIFWKRRLKKVLHGQLTSKQCFTITYNLHVRSLNFIKKLFNKLEVATPSHIKLDK